MRFVLTLLLIGASAPVPGELRPRVEGNLERIAEQLAWSRVEGWADALVLHGAAVPSVRGCSATATETAQVDADRHRGAVLVALNATCNDASVRVLHRFEVRQRRPVWVAARSLRPGEIVQSSDVRLENRELRIGLSLAQEEGEEWKRAMAVHPLEAGDALIAAAVTELPAIRARQLVQSRFGTRGVHGQVTAVALNEGRVGDVIRVRRGAAVLRGRVLGPQLVEVLP